MYSGHFRGQFAVSAQLCAAVIVIGLNIQAYMFFAKSSFCLVGAMIIMI